MNAFRSPKLPQGKFHHRRRSSSTLLGPLVQALCLLLLAGASTPALHAQHASAAAVQDIGISGWGAATGNWTDVSGGRNLAITAGGDVSFLTFRRLRPVLEIRGTYPFYQGQIDRQKSLMGGLKVERQFNRWHPYVDFEVGRGVISFQNGGYLYNGYLYFRTVSTVYSPGAGVDFDVSHHWSAKLDLQYQHWDTPVVPSGVVNPRLLSVGAIYNFDFNHHYKARRSTLR